ncbi:hypothetical protein JW859_02415 [bacterium]|nr:hypothetical protein [bacterium]
MIEPAALAVLSLDDLEEFADAYQRGQMRFVAEVVIEDSSGPLTPEQAALVLQVPQGAPYVEARFARMAKWAYGQGIFSRLEWEVWENTDGSVDIHLWYASRQSTVLAPDVSYNSLAGWLYGVRYDDYYYGGQNKQFHASTQFSENFGNEPKVRLAWTDNTVNHGRNSYYVTGQVYSNWRQRLRDTTNQMNIRPRAVELDAGYAWNGVKLGGLSGSVTVGVGGYNQDFYVLGVHQDLADDLPRSDFSHEGGGGYVSLAYSSARRDMLFTPRDGYYLMSRVEQHLGDFNFQRFKLDARKYIPVPNILGREPQRIRDEKHLDVRRMFPTASLAFQLQGNFADGDVPYNREIWVDSSNVARGFLYDSHAGTKLISGRAEYRFSIDNAGEYEGFVFSDHAGLGETLDDLQAFHSYGLGTLMTIPIYGGIKVGGYYGFSYDGADNGWGLSFGYQF